MESVAIKNEHSSERNRWNLARLQILQPSTPAYKAAEKFDLEVEKFVHSSMKRQRRIDGCFRFKDVAQCATQIKIS